MILLVCKNGVQVLIFKCAKKKKLVCKNCILVCKNSVQILIFSVQILII